MRTFVPDRTCWSLLLTALAIRLINKLTYDKLRVLIINKDVRKSLARKNENGSPIWSWNNSNRKINMNGQWKHHRKINTHITADSEYRYPYNSNWKTKTPSRIVVGVDMKRTYTGHLVEMNLAMMA